VTVARVPHHPPSFPVAAARGLFGRWPYTLTRYQSTAFASVLRERVAVLTPAFVLASPLHMAPYVESLEGTPMVLRQHNVEYLWMERYARERGIRPAGIYARTQVARIKRAEAALCRASALTLAIQDGEAETLRALAPGARVETLPVGIDFNRYSAPHPDDPPILLLAASFAWAPNVQGAIRFLSDGWPRVRASAPHVRLRLAGKAPPPALLKAARRAGAEIQADVPSMPEEFAHATILLVPLWVGAGARVKIIEALAARLPVVATSLACEGLGLVSGKHFLAGDSAAELGQQAVALLHDPTLRQSLADAGRKLAVERWALPSVARLQNDLIAQVAR
jgi:glycosyltransferase involved in cell wall biosynthesis